MEFLKHNKYYASLLATTVIGCGLYFEPELSNYFKHKKQLQEFAIESNACLHYLHLKKLPESELKALEKKCKDNNCKYNPNHKKYMDFIPYYSTTCDCPEYLSYYGLLLSRTNFHENNIAYHKALWHIANLKQSVNTEIDAINSKSNAV